MRDEVGDLHAVTNQRAFLCHRNLPAGNRGCTSIGCISAPRAILPFYERRAKDPELPELARDVAPEKVLAKTEETEPNVRGDRVRPGE